MGVVLKGRDADLGRDVAVKVLLEVHRGHAELERRFVEEAQIAGQLQHPGVVPVYEMGRFPDKRPYFAMKLVKGRTLEKLLEERDTPPGTDLPRWLGIFEQVCQAVAYAHSKGVIHRDLKPSNVMVGAFGEVQVMDWGLAKVLKDGDDDDESGAAKASVIYTGRSGSARAESDTQAGSVMGTPAYMAPEQARGEVAALDERCDVFGLGAMLCHILTGRPPFAGATEGAMARARAGAVADACARLDACGADAELIALAKGCLSAEPAGRPRDAGAVAAALRAHLDSVGARLRRAELERAAAEAKVSVERRARRLTAGLAAAMLLLLAGAGGGAWWAQQQRREADARVGVAIDEAQLLRGQAKEAPLGDAGKYHAALAAAEKAVELARAGPASEDVRREAAALVASLQDEEGAARRDRVLLAALAEVRGPREGPTSQGPLAALAEPSADAQFAAAFRAWGLDVDGVPTAAAAARLKGRPAGVVTEVIAALDEWAGERREDQALEGKDPEGWRRRWRRRWQRVADLAAALDDAGSRQALLRALLARDGLGRERALGALSAALRPVPVPFDAGPGEDRGRLRRLAAETDAPTEPLLGLLTLARALRVAGDDLLGERLLRSAVRARPQEVVLQRALGAVLASQRRWAEAAECYAAVRAVRPELGVALAEALLRSGRGEEGLALYERLVKDRPDDPWRHFRRGYALVEQGRYQEAEAAYREALRLQPDDPDSYCNLGVVLGRLGRYAAAEAACREALRLQPDLPEVHLNRGFLLFQQGRHKEAEDAYREALRLRPNYADAYSNLSSALYGQGRDREAEAAGREAIRLNSDAAQAHYNLGNALGRQGRFREAEAACRQALRLKPDFALAHSSLGTALYTQGRYREAEAAYRQALRFRPEDLGADLHLAHCHLGLALNGQGRPGEGEAAIREAIRLKPDYAAAYCYLGFALRDQGRLTEALAELRRGHALGSKVPGWSRPSADWVRECERLVELDGKLPAVLRGEAQPSSPAERVELASLCQQYKRLEVTATGLYAAAFAADPKLADDWRAQHRYNAACSAVLAAAGQGNDARRLPDKVVVMLRRQALAWLRADLALYAKLAESGDVAARQLVRQQLGQWQKDSDLAAVRDPQALDGLPEGERWHWRALWEEVAALLKRDQSGGSGGPRP
jgi:serine/threonine-protein kinase